MAATLKGRLTRAVNSIRITLEEIEQNEDEISRKIMAHDKSLMGEIQKTITMLETKVNTSNAAFEAIVKFIKEIQEDDKRNAEDKKLQQFINTPDGFEEISEKAAETISTLKLIIQGLSHTEPQSEALKEEPYTVQETQQQTHVVDEAPGQQTTLIPESTASDQSQAMSQFIRPENMRLHIPVFDGQKGDFPRFFSLFKATVDENPGLNNTVKLHMLLSHLKGDAARLVSGFTFDSKNYEAVKTTLQERYAAKHQVERNLYEQLNRLKQDARGDFASLTDRLEAILEQMHAHNINTETEAIRMTIEAALSQWVKKHVLQAQLLTDQWTTATLRQTLKKVAQLANRDTDERITAIPVYKKNDAKNASTRGRSPRSQQSESYEAKKSPNQKGTTSKRDQNLKQFQKKFIICKFCKKRGHLEEECCSKMKQVTSAVTSSDDIQPMSPIQMTTSLHPAQEVPLMLIEAPVINLETGARVKTLIFFDSGAQINFVSKKLAESLQINMPKKTKMTVNCFGGSLTNVKAAVVRLGIQNLDGSITKLTTRCIETIVKELPLIKIANLSLIREYRKPSILIGNRDMWKFVHGATNEVIDGLQCISSTLGTLLAGCKDSTEEASNATAAVGIDAGMLNQHIEAWNSLETIGIREPIEDDEDQQAWNTLKTKIKLDKGRYEVPLPFKTSCPNMPDNFGLCVKQMVATRQRMILNLKMQQSANKIVQEWVEKGIIEEVPEDEIRHPNGFITVYSPFHLVAKPNSQTTPFRLVHNGSASLRGAPSLNKLLCRGPVLLPNLIGTTLRFREHPIVVTADVTKAFLQLGLKKEYRDALRFIYPKSWNDPIKNSNLIHYRFCRVNFGLISSPFLLAGTLKLHFENKMPYGPEILRDTYVDNIMTTGQTPAEAENKMNFAKRHLKECSMELAQFVSNSKILQETWSQQSEENTFLGIGWNTTEDVIQFSFKSLDLSNITKRKLLSQLCSRFDQLGLTFPTIFRWKLAIQQLWREKTSWDDIIQNQPMINSLNATCPTIKVPRLICSAEEVDLVIFVDASKNAFAAVAYFVSTGTLPQIAICRARLAPIDGATIPKLELLAALMGTRLAKFLKKETSKTIKSITIYGYSMIVLHWILNKEAKIPRYEFRKRKPISYVFYTLCMMLICSTKASCPPKAEIMYRPHCTASGIVVGKYNDQICWEEVNCDHGFLHSPGRNELFSDQQCGPRCSCPKWSSQCVFTQQLKMKTQDAITRCEQACGGIACGCLTFGSGCRFSRTIADIDQGSPTVNIMECKWSTLVKLQITEEKAASKKKHLLLLAPGETSIIEGTNISISLQNINARSNQPSHKHFALTNTTAALLSDVQLKSAKILRCNERNECNLDSSQVSCRTADGVVTCQPYDNGRLTSAMLHNKLPLMYDDERYTFDGFIQAEGRGSVSLQIDTRGYETILETEISTCKMDFIEALGCYGCHGGTTINYECSTNFGQHLAEVKCGTTTFSIICGPGRRRSTTANFNVASLNERCFHQCPGSRTSFTLTAKLHFFRDDDDQWMELHSERLLPTNPVFDALHAIEGGIVSYVSQTYSTIILLFVIFVVFRVLFRLL